MRSSNASKCTITPCIIPVNKSTAEPYYNAGHYYDIFDIMQSYIF